MKRALFNPTSRFSVGRARTLLLAALVLFALSAVFAGSASAFSWWVGTPSEPKMLGDGARLPINSGGTVRSPFTLKWLHGYEVKCAGIKYDEMYLEGPVFLGAHSIAFEECAAKKPKGSSVVGGQIDTVPLTGEIKPAGSKVEFIMQPASGPLFAEFELKRAIVHKVHKSKRKRVRHRECSTVVSVFGHASGTLGDAATISTAKTFEFSSKALEVSQVKRCHKASPTDSLTRGRRAASTPLEEQEAEEKKALEEEEARELKEEEEQEALELEEEEARECKQGEKSPEECKAINQKLKEKREELGETAEEKREEAAEEAEEEAARPEEEEVKPIEGNKGKTGYSAFEGWGVL